MCDIPDQIFWTSQYNATTSAEDEATRQGSINRAANECLAVVPWIPSQFPQTSGTEVPQSEVSEMTKSEDMGTSVRLPWILRNMMLPSQDKNVNLLG